MSENYVCPFCGQVRETKKRMDFHLQYGHADLHPLMKRETTVVDLERKLDDLRDKKTMLEKEIRIMQTIIEKKAHEPEE
jgi:cell division protein FtsB